MLSGLKYYHKILISCYVQLLTNKHVYICISLAIQNLGLNR